MASCQIGISQEHSGICDRIDTRPSACYDPRVNSNGVSDTGLIPAARSFGLIPIRHRGAGGGLVKDARFLKIAVKL